MPSSCRVAVSVDGGAPVVGAGLMAARAASEALAMPVAGEVRARRIDHSPIERVPRNRAGHLTRMSFETSWEQVAR